MKRSILVIVLCISCISIVGIGWLVFERQKTNDLQQAAENNEQGARNNEQEAANVDSVNENSSHGEESDPVSDSTDVALNESSEIDTASGTESVIKLVQYNVPFMSQAPFGEWSVPEFQDGCEEASAIMVSAWISGEILSPDKVKKQLLNIATFENQAIGHSTDTSALDTKRLLFEEYFHLPSVELVNHFEKHNLIAALSRGIVIAPMNGRLLGNPNFTSPGPLHHMVVVIGYDPEAHEFITNDPGTRKGAGYRYDEDIFFRAARDYPTGIHEEPKMVEKNMIVVER